jgi:hypothetical protein
LTVGLFYINTPFFLMTKTYFTKYFLLSYASFTINKACSFIYHISKNISDADYNYQTKLRLKVKFFWSDKNGVVGSKLSFK